MAERPDEQDERQQGPISRRGIASVSGSCNFCTRADRGRAVIVVRGNSIEVRFCLTCWNDLRMQFG